MLLPFEVMDSCADPTGVETVKKRGFHSTNVIKHLVRDTWLLWSWKRFEGIILNHLILY